MKKKNQRIISILIAVLVLAGVLTVSAVPVMASDVATATIDFTKTASLSIYKYDYTNAKADDAWGDTYVSTGMYDSYVNDMLGFVLPDGASDSRAKLGNGEISYGYAIKGVEFTYLKVANITTYAETDKGVYHVEVLYAFPWNTNTQNLMSTIGLDENDRYAPADQVIGDVTMYYFQSDVLVDALSTSLTANATTVKNALESHVKSAGGTAMTLTDSTGYTKAEDLALGLYLVVETKVPEQVTATVDPFFVSLPMTSVDGTIGNSTAPIGHGGSSWLYDVTLYPKNSTGIPTLEKTVREAKQDTGKHDGTTEDITDGYKHNATASDGDRLEYQIVSTLPAITSKATYLSEYTLKDTLSHGITHNQDPVLTFYKNAACTEKIVEWTLTDDIRKFNASYEPQDSGETLMTISMPDEGIREINTADTIYTDAESVHSGYSDCTLRITYTATLDSDNSVIYGDSGNPNAVVLLWKRTSDTYYDTLTDDCHIYTFGLDLTKQFSDDNGDFSKVEFVLFNETDGYYVQAELNEDEGIYYVADKAAEQDHACFEWDATHFIPVESDGEKGKIIIKGLEDDIYTITEVRTHNKYTMLRDDIKVAISHAETDEDCSIYTKDTLGLIQNDPRYTGQILDSQQNTDFVQPTHVHKRLTASATVNGDTVAMLEDAGSDNALAPLIVVNTRGYELPSTGGSMLTFLVTFGTIAIFSASIILVVLIRKNKKHST